MGAVIQEVCGPVGGDGSSRSHSDMGDGSHDSPVDEQFMNACDARQARLFWYNDLDNIWKNKTHREPDILDAKASFTKAANSIQRTLSNRTLMSAIGSSQLICTLDLFLPF